MLRAVSSKIFTLFIGRYLSRKSLRSWYPLSGWPIKMWRNKHRDSSDLLLKFWLQIIQSLFTKKTYKPSRLQLECVCLNVRKWLNIDCIHFHHFCVHYWLLCFKTFSVISNLREFFSYISLL